MTTISKEDIYRSVSDLISDSYDWLSSNAEKAEAVQYILGMNDLARYLVENVVAANEKDMDGSDK